MLGSRGLVRYSFLLNLGNFKTNIYISSQELLPQTYFLSILVYILIFILILGSFYFLVRLYRKNEINWTFWLRFYLCLYTLSIFILVYFIALFQYFLCLPQYFISQKKKGRWLSGQRHLTVTQAIFIFVGSNPTLPNQNRESRAARLARQTHDLKVVGSNPASLKYRRIFIITQGYLYSKINVRQFLSTNGLRI